MANITIKRKQTITDGKIEEDYFVIKKEYKHISSDVLFLQIDEFNQLKELIKKYE